MNEKRPAPEDAGPALSGYLTRSLEAAGEHFQATSQVDTTAVGSHGHRRDGEQRDGCEYLDEFRFHVN